MSIIEASRELVPELASRAIEGEAERTMPADLVAELRRAGLFRMAAPRSAGGLELDPASIIDVVERISWADGSAGWTVLIGNSVAFFAWLEEAEVKAMFDGDDDNVSTGVFGPAGRAVRTGAGDHFVLDGRWAFNSGCLHADWYQTGFLVMDGDQPATRPDGRPDWRFAYYRREQAEVIDTWRAAGLRGTGSHDVAVHRLVIPEAHTAMPMFDPPRQVGGVIELGFSALTSSLLIGFPLGVGRRALDEVVTLAPTKRRPYQDFTVADDHRAQMMVGRAEAALGSARAFALDTFGRAWEAIEDGGAPTAEQQGRIMLATQHAMDAAVHAVDVAHELAGASVVYEDDPIGRCFRDIHAACQHVVFSGERLAEHARAMFAAAS